MVLWYLFLFLFWYSNYSSMIMLALLKPFYELHLWCAKIAILLTWNMSTHQRAALGVTYFEFKSCQPVIG